MQNQMNTPNQKHSVSLNHDSYVRLLQLKTDYVKNRKVNVSMSDMANIIISGK